MATSIKFKRKIYTKFDETDNIKRMKDSDILAEKPRKTNDYGHIATSAATGAAALGGAGLVIGAGKRFLNGGTLKQVGYGARSGGKAGLLIGGLGAATLAYKKGQDKAEENQFYNNRLAYAKRQALRRERKDWKTNMTQRDGYSY